MSRTPEPRWERWLAGTYLVLVGASAAYLAGVGLNAALLWLIGRGLGHAASARPEDVR